MDLSGGWFHSTLGITASLAGVVIVAIFVLELVKAVLRREPASLTRAAVGVGAGILGAAAQLWRLQVEPHFGNVRASRITTGQIREWVAGLLMAGLSRASVAQAVTVLSSCMKVAIEQGIRRDNPTRGCRPRPDVPEQGRGYSPEQVQALLSAADTRDAAIYLLAATTGPRFGELAGVRIADLDRETASVSVQRVVIESGGHQVVKAYPKGGSVARRTLALPPGVFTALKGLAEGRRSDAPLWPNRVGGPSTTAPPARRYENRNGPPGWSRQVSMASAGPPQL